MRETASHDPLTVGLAETRPQPCSLVILGGGGDLAKRKLLPAIYNLALDDVLPGYFAVVGFGRRALSDEDYRAIAREGIEMHSRRPLEDKHWADFRRSLFFVQGSFKDADAFVQLKKRLDAIEPEFGIPAIAFSIYRFPRVL